MNELSNIRAVTFDVGGTLIQPWPSVGHVYADAAKEATGREFDADRLNRQFVAAWNRRGNFGHRRPEWARLVDAAFEGQVDPVPSKSFFPLLYDRFGEAGAWSVFEDVRPALDQLASRGISLAIVSNWDDRLRPLLRALNLDTFFNLIVVSCEIGFSKPSPVIFEHTVRKLGLSPDQTLHVGDSTKDDVVGARAAGLRAVLLDRESGQATPLSTPSLICLDTMIGAPR